jgi:hypothetical protein
MIPKVIYQCGPWKENQIPSHVLDYSNTWKDFSEDWDYQYFDDEMCIEDIKELAGIDMAEMYKNITRGDNRADFWRCVHVLASGGFYADMDSKRIKTIDDIYCDTKKFISFRNHYPETGEIWENWFFGAEKDSEVLDAIVKKMCKNINLSNGSINANHTFFPFSQTVNKFSQENWFLDITDCFSDIVGHIAAHDNWDNAGYFINGGPFFD